MTMAVRAIRWTEYDQRLAHVAHVALDDPRPQPMISPERYVQAVELADAHAAQCQRLWRYHDRMRKVAFKARRWLDIWRLIAFSAISLAIWGWIR
jgi:hypothetical protein